MRLSDLLRLATENLSRRKGRTILTVIGVVVGTCAIVVMISLGLAMSRSIEEMLSTWGDLTQIQIYNYAYGQTDTPVLDDAMLKEIGAYEHVQAVTPFYQANNLNMNIYAGRNDRYEAGAWNVYGLYPEAVEPMGFLLDSGEYLPTEGDYGKNKIPVLIGANFAYSFEDTTKGYNSSKRRVYQGQTDSLGNPVDPFVDVNHEKMTLRLKAYTSGDEEKTQDYQLVVVGVMTSDMAKGYFTDSGIMMRLSDLKKLEKEYQRLSGSKSSSSSGSYMVDSTGQMYKQQDNGYQQVYIKVDEVGNVEAVEQKVKDLGYDTYSMVQVREQMQAQVAQTQFILGGLAAVSLFVAALNIANTMTMAIYERTREIGVMKVLGCEVSRIRTLFLVEAGGIGFLGGVVGVILSLLISFIMNNFTLIMSFLGLQGDLGATLGNALGYGGTGGSVSVIPVWLVLFALAFATMVGLVSGVLPAVRATRISALEAIRHE